MEIIKNLNDSEEMIFLQAIDQNYLNYKIQSNEGISQQYSPEENSYSDLEDYFPNINFNFIEFNDDSRNDSPCSKPYKINENSNNSIFSNESTEAENNMLNPNNNQINNSQIKSFNMINNNSNSNQSSCSSRKHSLLNTNNNEILQKNFFVELSNNNILKEHKKNSELIKNFLVSDYSNDQKLYEEIGKYKDKLKKEITEKLISHRKYLEYLKFYNASNRFNQNQNASSPTTPTNVSLNFNVNFNNNFNQINNINLNNLNLKSSFNQQKVSLDVNSASFISNHAYSYLNSSYNITKMNSGNLINNMSNQSNEKMKNEKNNLQQVESFIETKEINRLETIKENNIVEKNQEINKNVILSSIINVEIEQKSEKIDKAKVCNLTTILLKEKKKIKVKK
jgi:hypothetical protein